MKTFARAPTSSLVASRMSMYSSGKLVKSSPADEATPDSAVLGMVQELVGS